MRKVIVNSTPLIILCNIGKINILKELYCEIYIPKAVFNEVTVKEDSICQLIKKEDWIHVKSIQDIFKKKMYKAKLHDGEVESLKVLRTFKSRLMRDGMLRIPQKLWYLHRK